MQKSFPSEETIIRELEEIYAAERQCRKALFSKNPREELEKQKALVQRKVNEGLSILSSLYEESKKRGGPTIPFLESSIDAQNKERVLQEVESGKELSDCFNLDDVALENLYRLTIPLFDGGRWHDLAQGMFVLTLLSPTNPSFLQALGHTEYQQERYSEARALYITAYYMNPENNAPMEDAIDCCEKMGDDVAKRECLKILGQES